MLQPAEGGIRPAG